MRLALKLALVLMLGVSAVLAIQGALHVSRALAVHERETAAELELLGWAIADAASAIWRDSGRDAAEAYLARAEARHPDVSIRLVPLGPREGRPDLLPPPQASSDGGPGLGGEVVLRVPLLGLDEEPAALELVRTSSWAETYVADVVRFQLLTAGALVLVSGLFSLLFGVVLVGRRVERLIEQAREVVRGRFSQTSDRHKDELGKLARELNLMVQHLAAARLRVQSEKRRRTELLERLRHADRLSTVGKLSSSMAHELGTPLNVVSGRASLIQMEDDISQEVRDNARIIQEQAERMAGIIRELLDYARSKTLDKGSVALREILEEAKQLLDPLAEENHVELQVAETPEGHAQIDSSKVLQVVTNLITNAIQAMPDGGTVTLSAFSEHIDEPPDARAAPGDYWGIVVADNGPGMPPKVLERVFRPFFTTKVQGKGTGLGLSVCQEIVAEHGGWIHVESEPGEGARFTVYLPKGES